MRTMNAVPPTREQFMDWLFARMPPDVRERLKARANEEALRPEDERRQEDARDKLNWEKECSQNYRRLRHDRCGMRGDQWKNTFETFKLAGTPTEKSSQAAGLRVARAFAEKFPDTPKGLAFYGPFGTGKDHLLHSVAQVVLDKERIYDVRYAYGLDIVDRLLREWQTHNDPDTRTAEVMLGCDLLLIGDIHLALSNKSQGVRDTMLRIVNQAESVGRPILCITTNFGLSDAPLSSEWADTVKGAISSRLADCCEWHELRGPDRRRQPGGAGERRG